MNDRIKDAAQKLNCKKLGADEDYQSVLIVQKRGGAPYRASKNEHIQQLHDGSGHWLLTFCSNGRIQIYLIRVSRKCVHAIYKNYVKEFIISFVPVQKQIGRYNCGPFLITFEA